MIHNLTHNCLQHITTEAAQATIMDIPSFMYWATVFLGLLLAMYLYVTKNYDYFLRRNMPSLTQIPFVGNLGPVVFRTRSYPDHVKWMYDMLKAYSYGGVFQLATPYIMICDPSLIQAITEKDSEHFVDHNLAAPRGIDPELAKTLPILKGQQLKEAQSILTSIFTSSTMKMMIGLVSECSVQVVDYLQKCCGNYTPEKTVKITKDGDLLVVEMRDMFTRFANDVIATTTLGISVDSLTNPTNEVYTMGSQMSESGMKKALIWFGYLMCAPLMRLLNFTLVPKDVINFFKSTLFQTIHDREREGIVRQDLIQALIQAKKDAHQDESSPKSNTKLDEDLSALLSQFLLASLHSITAVLCFSTHQLAVHPDLQDRLREEIDDAMKQCGDNLTYEVVQNLKYLDMVLCETLRMYPPQSTLERWCVKQYTLPVQIEPGDAILLPVFGLHHDPEYFPDPERFDPDRFSEQHKNNIKPHTYMPFGYGSSACIGKQFVLMEAKVALIHLLSRFILKVVSRTQVPLEISKMEPRMTVDRGFWLGLEQRSKTKTVN